MEKTRYQIIGNEFIFLSPWNEISSIIFGTHTEFEKMKKKLAKDKSYVKSKIYKV